MKRSSPPEPLDRTRKMHYESYVEMARLVDAYLDPEEPLRILDVGSFDVNGSRRVNLTGAFLCDRAVAPHMVQRRSRCILHISSVAGLQAYPLRAPYAVSKWGLIGLTETLAAELDPYNIRVNAVCPGPVRGDRMDRPIGGKK